MVLRSSEPRLPPARPLRILIVEDYQDAADSLQWLLELSGHHALQAYSGPAGLEAARTFRPDVVLCDLALPGMDGFAVAQAFRRDPAMAHLRLIAVSGHGRAEDRRRALEAGFEDHLLKPVAADTLHRVLARPSGDHPG